MPLKKLFQAINGAHYVHYDESAGILATWDGDEMLRFFDAKGQCRDSLLVDEPFKNRAIAEMMMLEHLEGVDQKQ